jgi:hypothetical protein
VRTATAFQYNADVRAADNADTTRAYGAIAALVSWPEFRTFFDAVDQRALRAKAKSRRSGLAAIALGTTALLLSALSPVLESGLIAQGLTSAGVWLGSLAALCGMLSVVLAGRVLHGSSKRAWLCDRMAAERCRQFSFQMFPRRLDELAAAAGGSAADQARFIAERDRWFVRFRDRLSNAADAELTDLLDTGCEDDGWLHPRSPAPPVGTISGAIADLLGYYKDKRILHQIQYVNTKLGSEDRGWSETTKAEAFDRFSLISVALIFSVYAIWLVVVVFPVGSGISSDMKAALNVFAHVGTLTLSVLVLGARALEAGLQPGREVERLLAYRARLRSAARRFDAADRLDVKVSIMEEVEAVAFAELVTFLETHNAARFRM